MDGNGSNVLRVAEVARRLGLAESSVYRKIYDGTLPAVRLGGPRSALRVDERDRVERAIRVLLRRGPLPVSGHRG